MRRGVRGRAYVQYRIAGIFRQAKVSFFGERLDFVGFNSRFSNKIEFLPRNLRPFQMYAHIRARHVNLDATYSCNILNTRVN